MRSYVLFKCICISYMASMTLRAAPAQMSKGFNARAFYEVLASIVGVRSLTWREVARQTGITPSTLTRMGQGRQPDASSLAALSAWAGLNPADFVERPTEAARAHLLVVLSRVLRADPGLRAEAANALEEIMRIAYDQCRRQDHRIRDSGTQHAE